MRFAFQSPWRKLRSYWNQQREGGPGTVAGVRTGVRAAALTFDDGPHPEYTPRVLDLLGCHGAHATFFMVGCMAKQYPEIVQSVVRAGHAIGNHTWDHPWLPGVPRTERRDQILACKRVLGLNESRLFRPPYGAQSLASGWDAMRLGYRTITWNLASRDWLPQEPAALAERLVAGIRPGSIVLLHDAIYRSQQAVPQYNREAMLSGLALFLERLGGVFQFLTIPDLLKCGRVEKSPKGFQNGMSHGKLVVQEDAIRNPEV